MSALSIVAISVFSVLFLILLLAAASSIVYAHILLKREIQNFTLLVNQVSGKLDSNHVRMESLVSNIRGDKIEKAAQDFIAIVPRQAALATRIEGAVVLFSQLVKAITEEQGISGSAIDRARESGLLPESYAVAAPGEHYVTRSKVADGDAAARAEESADNTSTIIDDIND